MYPYTLMHEILQGLFILGVLAIIFSFPLLNRHLKIKERHLEERNKSASADRADLLDQLDRLEERVRVLERIVTDDTRDLGRQFRELGS